MLSKKTIPDFNVEATLAETEESLLFRARHHKDGRTILLKVLKEEYPSLTALYRFKNEQQLFQWFDQVPGVLQLIHLHQANYYQPLLLFKEVQGTPLSQCEPLDALHIKSILGLAIQLLRTLLKIHEKGITVNNLSAETILLDASSWNCHLFDLSLATHSGSSSRASLDEEWAPTPYSAPETIQSGKLSTLPQSDLYSFGVILYELLTQRKLCKESSEENRYRSIALQPPLPSLYNANIPDILEKIVVQCLEKNPLRRPLSACALLRELESFLEILERDNCPFPSSPKSSSSRFPEFEKEALFGKKIALKDLSERLEKQCHSTALVGPPSTGKSFLIHYVLQTNPPKYQLVVPISAPLEMDSCVEDAIKKVLAALFLKLIQLPPQEFEKLSRTIRALPAAIQQLIFPLISGSFLQFFSKEVLEPLEENCSTTSQGDLDNISLENGCRQLLLACASIRPLLLVIPYIDRWSTEAQDFFRMLFAIEDRDPLECCPLSLLCSLEGSSSVALPVATHRIPVEIPRKEDLLELLTSFFFDMEEREIEPLASQVGKKTLYIPSEVFFLLRKCLEQGVLWYDHLAGKWAWHIEEVSQRPLTDEIAKKITSSLEEKSEKLKHFLLIAALLGERFPTKPLSVLQQLSEEELLSLTREAIEGSLIDPEYYREEQLHEPQHLHFTHPWIHQAASALLPEISRAAIHQSIAIYYLETEEFTSLLAQSPQVASQLNQQLEGSRVVYSLSSAAKQRIRQLVEGIQSRGELLESKAKISSELSWQEISDEREVIGETGEKQKIESPLSDPLNGLLQVEEDETNESDALTVAKLNYVASQQSFLSGAYPAALRFAFTGHKLLPEDRWEQHYSLTYALYIQCIEAAYACKEIDDLEPIFLELFSNVTTLVDRLKVYLYRVNYFTHMSEMSQAIRTGLEGLALGGICLAANPSPVTMLKTLWRYKRTLRRYTPQTWIDLPPIESQKKLLLMRLMGATCTPSLLSNKLLLGTLSIEMLERSLVWGGSAACSSAMITASVILSAAFKDHKMAYKYASAAIAIADSYNNDYYRCRAHCSMAMLIHHWVHPFHGCRHHLDLCYASAAACGDVIFGSFACLQYGFLDGLFYINLHEVTTEIEKYAKEIEHSKNRLAIYHLEIKRELLYALTNPSFDGGELPSQFDEQALFSKLCNDPHLYVDLNFYTAYRSIIYYLFGRYEQALQLIESTAFARHAIASMTPESKLLFIHVLSLGGIANRGMSPSYSVKRTVRRACKKLERWAELCPENQKTRWLLAKATEQILGERIEEAHQSLNEAILYAQEKNNCLELLLAHELKSRLFLTMESPLCALIHLREAHYSAKRWGAPGVVHHLEGKITVLEKDLELSLSSLHGEELPDQSETWAARLLQTLGGICQETILLRELHRDRSHNGKKTTSTTLQTDDFPLLAKGKADHPITEELSAAGSSTETSNAPKASLSLNDLLVNLLSLTGSQRILFGPCTSNGWQIAAEIDQRQSLLSLECAMNRFSKSVVQEALQTEHVVCPKIHILISKRTKDNYLYQKALKGILVLPLLFKNRCLALIYCERWGNIAPFPDRVPVLVELIAQQLAIYLRRNQLEEELSETMNRLALFRQKATAYNQSLEEKIEQRSEELEKKNLELEKSLHQLQKMQQQIAAQEKFSLGGSVASQIAESLQLPLQQILLLAREATQELVEVSTREVESVSSDKQESIAILDHLRKNGEKILEHSERAETIIRAIMQNGTANNTSSVVFSLSELLAEQIRYFEIKGQGLSISDKQRELQITLLPGSQETIARSGLWSLVAAPLQTLLENGSESLLEKLSGKTIPLKKRREFLPSIVVGAREVDQKLEITVRDNGLGVSKENREKLFLPFFSTKAGGKSKGLGLATAYEMIVRQSGGEILCESSEGECALFTLLVPLEQKAELQPSYSPPCTGTSEMENPPGSL